MGLVSYIAEQFGNPTGVGGRVATWVMNRMNSPMYKVCYKELETCAPKRVLDIGFGNGFVLCFLSKRNSFLQLYGIDISSDAIQMASQRLDFRATLSLGSVTDLNS